LKLSNLRSRENQVSDLITQNERMHRSSLSLDAWCKQSCVWYIIYFN